MPLFAEFAERFVAVRKRDVKLAQFVACIANYFEGFLGVGRHIELVFINKGDHIAGEGIGLLVFNCFNDFAHLELARLVLLGPDDGHPFL